MDPTPNSYDIGEAVKLDVLLLAGETIGRIVSGQSTLYVRDPAGLDLSPGAPIVVEGAGYVGGDLTTTVVSAQGQVIVLADPAEANATLAAVGTPTDPATISCKVSQPDGSEVTLTPVQISTGRYRATFTPTLSGEHFYRYTSTGTASGDGWRKFVVRPERVA